MTDEVPVMVFGSLYGLPDAPDDGGGTMVRREIAEDADGRAFMMKTISVGALRALLDTLPDDANLMPSPITLNLIIIPAGEDWGDSENRWIDIGNEEIQG